MEVARWNLLLLLLVGVGLIEVKQWGATSRKVRWWALTCTKP